MSGLDRLHAANAGASFTDSFMRTYGFVQGMRERKEDREHAREREQITDQRYDAEVAHRGQREAKADEQADRTYALQLNQDERSGALTEETLQTSRQKRRQAAMQEKMGRSLARLDALEKSGAPKNVLGEATRQLVKDTTGYDLTEMLGDEWEQSMAHLDAVQSGKQQLRSRETIDAARVVLSPVLNQDGPTKVEKPYKTRDGQTIPAGAVIERRELADVIPYEGKLTFDLDVTVKLPDGSTVTYGAPMTDERSSDEADGVRAVPVGDVLKHVMGLKKFREAAKAMLQGEYLAVAGAANPRALMGARGGQSAQVNYLQFVADRVFGGDVAKAYQDIKTKPEAMTARLTQELLKQKDRRGDAIYGDPGRAQRAAAEIVQMVLEQGPDGAAGQAADADATADATAAPAAEAAEGEDQYEVGKVYVDANGNKAKYVGNGQWEEIQ